MEGTELAILPAKEEETTDVVADEVQSDKGLELQITVMRQSGVEGDCQVAQIEEQITSKAQVLMPPTSA